MNYAQLKKKAVKKVLVKDIRKKKFKATPVL